MIVQKTRSARNLRQRRYGTRFCAALKILPIFILVLPGLIAKALGPTEVTGDNAYPLVVTRLLPSAIKGLMPFMSSLSSVFNSCSTLTTMDIYKPWKPGATDR